MEFDDVTCPVACGLCCEDYGHRCPRLARGSGKFLDTKTRAVFEFTAGCTLPRGMRPPGCNRYLCSVGKAVLDGRLAVEEAHAMKAWDRENEKHRAEIT